MAVQLAIGEYSGWLVPPQGGGSGAAGSGDGMGEDGGGPDGGGKGKDGKGKDGKGKPSAEDLAELQGQWRGFVWNMHELFQTSMETAFSKGKVASRGGLD